MSDRRATICQLLISLRMGGAEVLSSRLARRLSGPFRFVFACLEELGTLGEILRAEGYPVHVLDKRPGVNLRAAQRLGRVVREERVDLIHAHHCGPFLYAALARLPAGLPPIVMTEHGRQYPDRTGTGRLIANRLLLRGRDRIFGVGEGVARALVTNEGFPAARVGVIFNGIDLSSALAPGVDRGSVREELGLGPDDVVVIQVARLNPLKDHLTAIRALEVAVGRRKDVRLVLVGDGPEEGRIREAIAARGLQSHVLMLGLRSDVPRLYRAADIALLTSISEGIPLAIIEAMAAGLPVVATRVGGVPEIIDGRESGMLAAAGDGPAIAEAIIRLAGDASMRRRVGDRARERAISEFSEDRMVDLYRATYGEMLAPARGARRGTQVVS